MLETNSKKVVELVSNRWGSRIEFFYTIADIQDMVDMSNNITIQYNLRASSKGFSNEILLLI